MQLFWRHKGSDFVYQAVLPEEDALELIAANRHAWDYFYIQGWKGESE